MTCKTIVKKRTGAPSVSVFNSVSLTGDFFTGHFFELVCT